MKVEEIGYTPEEDKHPYKLTQYTGMTLGGMILLPPSIVAECQDCHWTTTTLVKPNQRKIKLNLQHTCKGE